MRFFRTHNRLLIAILGINTVGVTYWWFRAAREMHPWADAFFHMGTFLFLVEGFGIGQTYAGLVIFLVTYLQLLAVALGAWAVWRWIRRISTP
jgi:hypothetical protein